MIQMHYEETIPSSLYRRRSSLWLAAIVLAVGLPRLGAAASSGAEPLDGVAFAQRPNVLYAPIRGLGQALDLPVHWDAGSETVYLNNRAVPGEELHALPDGRHLLRLRALEERGATVRWDPEQQVAHVIHNDREARVRKGEKRVAINLEEQQMRAWQGDLLVLDTRVSTGRPSQPTPPGKYTAGPLKRRLLISEKYGNARMPWSVQIRGDYVIHGFPSVPPRAASHGCVRVPLTGANPARWFYRWIDVGTPIAIQEDWPAAAPQA